MVMPLEYKIPDWAKNADFVVSTYGDNNSTILTSGWGGVVKLWIDCHYHNPDDEQVQECMTRLTDWEEWDRASDSHPWCLHVDYEDGGISVRRITHRDTFAGVVNDH